VRCVIFAAVFGFEMPFAARLTLAGVGQALHGFCFGCFLAAAFMYIDDVVRKDLRGSMQTLYGTCVLGIGFFLGGWVGSGIGEVFTTDAGATTLRDQFGIGATAGLVEFATRDGVQMRDWPGIWLSCAAIAAVGLAIFVAAFPRRRVVVESPEAR
jgi:MFS family permease